MNKKDMYCISRILQGAIFKNELFYSCRYCKYEEECTKNLQSGKTIHLEDVRKKLQNITGVYLDTKTGSRDMEELLSLSTNINAVKQ